MARVVLVEWTCWPAAAETRELMSDETYLPLPGCLTAAEIRMHSWRMGVAAFAICFARLLRPSLVPKKFCKIFQILRHIKSLDTCMKY